MNEATPSRLDGRVAIVTGSGRGLGRAEALELAKAGAKVVVNDFGGTTRGEESGSENVAEQVADEIRAAGGEAVADLNDISSMAGAAGVVGSALKAFGRIDILINNAGIARPCNIKDMTEEDWDSVIRVHLKGHFAMVRQVAPVMIEQGDGGVIVNFASQSGLGHWGNANYSAAKEGVVGFTRTVARDLGEYGIRVNAVRPLGWTRLGTPDMMETIRYSQDVLGIPGNGNIWVAESAEIPTPEQVGVFVAWLCTEAAAKATGRTFYVGGGTIGLYPEPDPVRSVYRTGGWTLDTLDSAGGPQLIGDLENKITRTPASA